MISESEALQRILDAVSPLAAETLPVPESLRRFVARDVIATVPIPAFNQSAMDGYALRAAESRGSLRITGEQAADAAFIDEVHQMERWGSDSHEEARLAQLRTDLGAVERFLALLG